MLEELRSQLKTAMLAKDELKTSVLRGLITAVKNEAIQQKKDDLTEEEFIAVVKKQVKQRKDSIESFQNAGREDAAEKEKNEQALLEAFLPEAMPEEELIKIIEEVKAEQNISEKKDFGRLMGMVMKKVAGGADGDVVKNLVQQSLS